MNLNSITRTLGLVWRRLGPARVYVALAFAVLLGLAVIGLVHLSTPRSHSLAKAPVSEKTSDALPSDPLLAITEIGVSEATGRSGQHNVSLKIGVAPKRDARHGEVEIRVAFFDVTSTGEMRPTDAQVDYKWQTPTRDWGDLTPKYLVATYAQAPARSSGEKLRYGGFVVRIYFDGKLQAERSEPKELVASLRSRPSPAAVAAASPRERPNTPTRMPQPSPSPRPSVENAVASVSATPVPANPQAADSSALPYGSPVPNKPGFVYSPYDPKYLIDVRGFPPGTQVTDPNSGKTFRVP